MSTQYFYIRNISTGEAITVDSNSSHYAVLKPLDSGNNDLQQWHINSSGQIKSKGTSNGKNYCLTMNKTDEDTHILALREDNDSITDNKSIFRLTSSGGIKNVHYGYMMHKVDDDQSSVQHNTIKVHAHSARTDQNANYRWAWIPVGHTYGLTLINTPTTQGGLLSGTVDGALNTSYLRLYIYHRSGSGAWTKVGSPITPRPNGSWAVNLTAASSYGVLLCVEDVAPEPSLNTFPTSPAGEILAVTHFDAAAPVTRYAAQSSGSTPVVTLSNWPFEFIGGQDFTIELWVRATAPGAFFGTKPVDARSTGWDGILLGMAGEDGSILFGISDSGASGSPAATFISNPTLVGDGGWHHVAAMRIGETLAVFLDGVPLQGAIRAFNGLTGQTAASRQIADIRIVNQQFATLGGAYTQMTGGALSALPYTLPDYGFHGAIDAIRVWKSALTPYAIRSGMYAPVDAQDTRLLGWWTFDNHQVHNKTTHAYTTGVSSAVTYDSQNVVQTLPTKQPYLTAQCKLMDDYPHPTSSATTATYHTVLSLWDANGNRMPNARIYLKASASCTIAIPQGDSYANHNLSTSLSQLTTNLVGELNFTYVAGDNLTAPTFSVQADFMASDEWLLIFPDRHAHHELATLTGDKLLHSKPSSNLTRQLVANSVDLQSANALASAVNNFMASALEHDVQAGYPMILLADEQVGDLFKPVPRLYQNPSVAPVAYNPASDTTTPHFAQSNSSLQRIVSGDAMPIKHWCYANNQFTTTTHSEVQARVKASPQPPVFLNTAAAVNQAMIDSGKASFTRDEVAALVRQHQTLQLGIVSSIRDWVRNAASVVVSVTTHIIEGAAEALHVISLWANDVEAYVLETVDDALSAVDGLFAKFNAAAHDIIDFIKATFDWGDILTTQAVLKSYLTQAVPKLQAQTNQLKSSFLSGLDTIQQSVDNHLQSAIDKLSDQTLGDGKTRLTSDDPQDIQSSYLLRNTTTYMTSSSASVAVATMHSSGQSTLESVFSQLISDVSNDVDALRALAAATPSFTTLFSDPQAFFKAGACDVISAVRLLWDVAMDLLKAGVEGVFDAFNAVLSSIDTLLKTRIVIPFVTDLYEHVINPHSTLTGYDLLALFGAAPLTIGYKLAHHGALPFADDTLVLASAKAASTSTDEKVVKGVSWGLGFICSGAILVWGACNAAGQAEGNTLKFVGALGVIAEFAVFACSAPIYFALGSDPLSILNATIWGTFAIPLVLDAGELFTPKASGAYIWSEVTTWNLFIKPGINVALGVIHTLSFLASASWETANIAQSDAGGLAIGFGITNAWIKAIFNIISVVPELDKALLFTVDFAELVPPIDAAAFATWGIGTAVLTGTDLLANIETVIR